MDVYCVKFGLPLANINAQLPLLILVFLSFLFANKIRVAKNLLKQRNFVLKI